MHILTVASITSEETVALAMDLNPVKMWNEENGASENATTVDVMEILIYVLILIQCFRLSFEFFDRSRDATYIFLKTHGE